MEFPVGPSERSSEAKITKIPSTPKEKEIKTKAQWMKEGRSGIPQPTTSQSEGAAFKKGLAASKQKATTGAQAALEALDTLTGESVRQKPRTASPTRSPREQAVPPSPAKSPKEQAVPPGSPLLSVSKSVSKKELEAERGKASEEIRKLQLKEHQADEEYHEALQAKQEALGKSERALEKFQIYDNQYITAKKKWFGGNARGVYKEKPAEAEKDFLAFKQAEARQEKEKLALQAADEKFISADERLQLAEDNHKQIKSKLEESIKQLQTLNKKLL